jgi:hypothetical protein
VIDELAGYSPAAAFRILAQLAELHFRIVVALGGDAGIEGDAVDGGCGVDLRIRSRLSQDASY